MLFNKKYIFLALQKEKNKDMLSYVQFEKSILVYCLFIIISK